MLRTERPASQIVTLTSFSLFKGTLDPYQFSVFEAAGYKWRLVLYANGKLKDGVKDHISLYARIEDTESLPKGWEVNVVLTLFVYNAKQNKYLTVSDGTVKRYSESNKELGIEQLIPHSTIYNTNEGYIHQDTGTFGAEIFIYKPVETQQKVTIITNLKDNIFTWKITHFSILEDKFYYSDDFLVEGRYWRLGFNPKGVGGGRPHALPLFLYASGYDANTLVTSTYGGVNLRLKNQRNSNHIYIYKVNPYSPLSLSTCPLFLTVKVLNWVDGFK